jgi:uncharacterized protein
LADVAQHCQAKQEALMTGEQDLKVLLRSMEPELFVECYGFGVVPEGQALGQVFARITEAEGVTVIAPLVQMQAQGIESAGEWARISLTVHSDLAAVGLTAAIAAALTARGISANVVAGFYHDHVFVQWERRDAAMVALRELSHV